MQLSLSTDCFKAICGFDHTGTIGLVLPSDVSFTSDSGVFLSAAAVPEPASSALLLAGSGSAVRSRAGAQREAPLGRTQLCRRAPARYRGR